MRTAIVGTIIAFAFAAGSLGDAQQAPAPSAQTTQAQKPSPSRADESASMGKEEDIWETAKRQGCAGVQSYLANHRPAKYCKEALDFLKEKKCPASSSQTAECVM